MSLLLEVILIDIVDRLFELVDKKYNEQKDFAALLGVNPTLPSRWRNRKSTSYNKYLPQIAVALGTTTEYLLTGSGPKSRDQIVMAGDGAELNTVNGGLPPIPGTGTIYSGSGGTGKSDLLANTLQPINPENFHRIP